MRALARRLVIVSGLSATTGLMENSEVVLTNGHYYGAHYSGRLRNGPNPKRPWDGDRARKGSP
jgi:hypothetical protein